MKPLVFPLGLERQEGILDQDIENFTNNVEEGLEDSDKAINDGNGVTIE